MIMNNKINQDTIYSEKERKKRANTLFFALVIIVSFVFVHILNHFGGITIISGDSMNPTYLNREFHIYSANVSEITQGDVIIFKNDEQTNGNIFVKRVIGVPGDKVVCIGTKIYVNGKELHEKYVVNTVTKEFNTSCTVGKDELFVCGDNRDESYDSRTFGCIKTKDVIGKIKE